MMNPLHSVRAISLFGSAGILAQIVPSDATVKLASELTLEAALVIAVAVLWKALGAKDKQQSEDRKIMTILLAEVQELRTEVKDLRKHK